MKNLLASLGLKRYLAAIVSGITSIVVGIPGLAFLIPILTAISAALGATGIVHGTVSSNLLQYKITGLASIVAILILVCEQVPQLKPYLPILQAIAAALGGGAVVQRLVTK